MKSFLVIQEIFKYASARKKYWLVPFAILLVAMAVILLTSQASVIAPFIYALF